MYKKWRPIVPDQFKDIVCPMPTAEELGQTQKEGKNREELRRWKKDTNSGVVAAPEAEIFGDDGGGKMPAEAAGVEDSHAGGENFVDLEAVDASAAQMHLPEASM